MAAKLSSPAAERNRKPIAGVLAQVLPASGRVLEIASGSGQHVAYFGQRFPAIEWQPSDIDPAAMASVEARRLETGLGNIRVPLRLDVTDPCWPRSALRAATGALDAIYCANMIHIAPWASCEGLFRGAQLLLSPGQGRLVLYGPFAFRGKFTAESNLSFDRYLRSQDPAWGVRDLAEVERCGGALGLVREHLFPMPANNHVVVFVRRNARPVCDPERLAR